MCGGAHVDGDGTAIVGPAGHVVEIVLSTAQFKGIPRHPAAGPQHRSVDDDRAQILPVVEGYVGALIVVLIGPNDDVVGGGQSVFVSAVCVITRAGFPSRKIPVTLGFNVEVLQIDLRGTVDIVSKVGVAIPSPRLQHRAGRLDDYVGDKAPGRCNNSIVGDSGVFPRASLQEAIDHVVGSGYRSEEHTSELQSHLNL